MDSLNILGGRLRDCIKSHLLQFGKGDIKGNVYILLGGDEFTLSISDLCEGNGELPRKEKYLGGYYDKVKAMLPEGEPDKHYVTFVDFFSDICMDTCIRESTRKNYFRTLDTLGEYAPEAAFCDIDKTFVCGYERFLCSMGMKANTIVKHMKHLKKAPRQALPERICQTFHRGIVQPLQCKTGENFQGKPDDQGTGCALSIFGEQFRYDGRKGTGDSFRPSVLVSDRSALL